MIPVYMDDGFEDELARLSWEVCCSHSLFPAYKHPLSLTHPKTISPKLSLEPRTIIIIVYQTRLYEDFFVHCRSDPILCVCVSRSRHVSRVY